jgi:sugar transferase (PEP-CTERM/EpsH1 system associated)
LKQKTETKPPLIVHVIYQLGVGGLENGVVNLINNMPSDKYRHAIICLTTSNDFESRLNHRDDVVIFQLHKQPGQDWMSFVRMYRLLKKIQPTIFHTRNLGTIEYQVPAFFAGIKCRIHGEHGWDVFDPSGENKKYQWIRRILNPFIQRFIPLSKELEGYLTEKVGVPQKKITRICNGVDTAIFYPRAGKKPLMDNCPFLLNNKELCIGTVGRMHGVKDQLTLVQAFINVIKDYPELKKKARLIVVGEGPLKLKAEQLLVDARLQDIAWLPGKRDDVADIMRCLDIFVLPSAAEGISNTILEAMATGLPIIATNVGGNPELVIDGETGSLVEKQNPAMMAESLASYLNNNTMREQHGRNARKRITKQFSLQEMLEAYLEVYDSQTIKLT